MGVYFVVYQVVQFEYVYVVDGGWMFELVVGMVVEQMYLVVFWQVGQFQYGFDFVFFGVIEYWGCYWYVIVQVFGQCEDFVVVQFVEVFFVIVDFVVDFVQEFMQFGDFVLFFEYVVDFFVQFFGCEVQVGFEDLIDVYM